MMTARKFELEVKHCLGSNRHPLELIVLPDVYLNGWNLFQSSSVVHRFIVRPTPLLFDSTWFGESSPASFKLQSDRVLRRTGSNMPKEPIELHRLIVTGTCATATAAVTALEETNGEVYERISKAQKSNGGNGK